MSYYKLPNLSKEQLQTYETLSVLEASARQQSLIDAERRAFAEQEKQDAEREKLLAKHRAEREAELKREAEAERKMRAANFEATLRDRFFLGNSFATEADFQAMLPELRKRAMLENTDMADKSEAAMRASGNYAVM